MTRAGFLAENTLEGTVQTVWAATYSRGAQNSLGTFARIQRREF